MKNKKVKEPKFEVNQIVENMDGWKRKIVVVIDNYLGEEGRFGYGYLSEDLDLEFTNVGMCSESHLIQWMRR